MRDKTYDEYWEELEAIANGNATELTPCYLCYLEETGEPDMSLNQQKGPLRGILKTFVTPGPDPYEAYHLSCGHVII